MKLEETIQVMYDRYPQFFQERWECLDFLFCVIGNGFEWLGGELINEDVGLIFTSKLDDSGIAIQRNIVRRRDTFTIENTVGEPSRGYSSMYTFGEDIREDWMNGVLEMKAILDENNIKY